MPLNSNNSNGQNIVKRDSETESASHVYIHAKTERLATAVYLVTRFVDANEPLRTELRAESLSLLSEITVLESASNTHKIFGMLQKIISLLDIAYRTNYISEMNWTVLRREYVGLRLFIEERGGSSLEQTPAIEQSFFDIGDIPKAIDLKDPTMSIGQVKKEVLESVVKEIQNIPQKTATTPGSFIKDKTKGQRKTVPMPMRKTPAVEKKKSNRRELILELIQSKKNISVRDAAEVVPDVSEKTLQRELLAMVSEGVLRKEGERRWSTYYLA